MDLHGIKEIKLSAQQLKEIKTNFLIESDKDSITITDRLYSNLSQLESERSYLIADIATVKQFIGETTEVIDKMSWESRLRNIEEELKMLDKLIEEETLRVKSLNQK